MIETLFELVVPSVSTPVASKPEVQVDGTSVVILWVTLLPLTRVVLVPGTSSLPVVTSCQEPPSFLNCNLKVLVTPFLLQAVVGKTQEQTINSLLLSHPVILSFSLPKPRLPSLLSSKIHPSLYSTDTDEPIMP